MGDKLDEVAETLRRISPARPYGEKKWEIVQAAAGLFIKKGSINTGVRDIAEASGITVGTLYHYFKSKDDIIAAFMDVAVDATNEFVKAVDGVLQELGSGDALRLAMQRYFEFVTDMQNIVLFWHQETRNLKPELRKVLLENELVLIGLFERIIGRGIEAGVFRDVDERILAHDIIVLGDMWAFRRWDLGKNYAPAMFIEKQTNLILFSLCGESREKVKKSREVKAGQ